MKVGFALDLLVQDVGGKAPEPRILFGELQQRVRECKGRVGRKMERKGEGLLPG